MKSASEGGGLTREDLRSLRLHQAVRDELLIDHDRVISIARANIAAWLPKHRPDGMSARYLRQWQRILDSPTNLIARQLVETDEMACSLRQNSPFAGVLTEQRRQEILQRLRGETAEDPGTH